MMIPVLFVAGILGTVQPSPIATLTPDEIIADHAALYGNTLSGKQGPLVVRFTVGLIDEQTVTNVDQQTYRQIMIHPDSGVSADAEFSIAITPQAEKAFKRLGIFDLKRHFRGKEIEIQGPLSVTYQAIYASPTYYMYHIDIKDLQQIRMVEPVKSELSDTGFQLPTWRVPTD